MDSMTLNISLPTPLVKKADKLATTRFATRSDLIREALFKYVRDQEEWDKIFAWGKRVSKKMGLKSEADVDKIVYEFRHGKKT